MADFKAALKEGFAAAEKAETARAEVSSVLKELKDEILEVTDQMILIEITPMQRDLSPMERLTRSTSAIGLEAFIGREVHKDEKVRYMAITARRNTLNQDSRIKELAGWKEGRDGYPCVISWGKSERLCDDRVSLEMALSELLRDPLVAERLKSLLR